MKLAVGRRTAWLACLLPAIVVTSACSYEPIPLSAAPGSTIALPLHAEVVLDLQGNPAGYEGEIYRQHGQFDDQRGELVFTLSNGTDAFEMTTRMVTRLQPDPASRAGIENDASGHSVLQFVGISQVMAVLDVPAAATPGLYEIQVTRRRRDPAGGYETLPGEIGYPGQLQVLDVPPEPPTSGEIAGDSSPVARLYPHPKLVFELPTAPLPSAARIELSYPEGITPLTAFEEQHLGRGSIVRWNDDALNRTVTIHLVDPDATVSQLAVAFELPAGPLDAAELPSASDFAVLTESYYDGDGAPLAAAGLTLLGIR